MVKGQRWQELNLVGQSNKGLHKKGAGRPWHMQTFKEMKLGLMHQENAWVHKHSRANNHVHRLRHLREGI
jgi:hypothetical protein